MTATRIKEGVRRLGLSVRESQVVECLAQGYSTQQTAEVRGISPNTVRTHLRKIFAKLGVNSRTELLSHVLMQVVADCDGDQHSATRLGGSAGETGEAGVAVVAIECVPTTGGRSYESQDEGTAR